jgi:hypothetical protein
MEKERIANKRFGEIITDGFNLFSKTYFQLIIPLTLFLICSIIINVFLLTDLRWYVTTLNVEADFVLEELLLDPYSISEEDYNVIMQSLMLDLFVILLDTLIGTIITTIALCSVSLFLYKKYTENESNFVEDFKKAFNKKMFPIVFLLGLGLSLGSLLFFIPSIIIFALFIFSIFTYNIDDIERPASKARLIAKGNYLRIIGIFIIVLIILLILDFIISLITVFFTVDAATYWSWYNPATRNYGMIIIDNLIGNIAEFVISPLFICLMTPLFVNSKFKKEIGYVRAPGYYRQRSPYRQSYTPQYQEEPQYQENWKSSLQSRATQQGSGIFCPFCGEKITTPKKFCPNCGEELIGIEF